jgi:hypothetical protein
MVTDQFVPLAKAASRSRGVSDLNMVILPHPFESIDPDTVRQMARERAAEIVKALVKEEK